MSRLPSDEMRRLVSYLRTTVSDTDRLIEFEGELAGEDAESLLLEPDFLAHFPQLTENLAVAGMQWQLHVIPHAHLRMVQRSIKIETVLSIFTRFVEKWSAEGRAIIPGRFAIYERSSGTILRADVDIVEAESGKGHIVTVFIGRNTSAETIELD